MHTFFHTADKQCIQGVDHRHGDIEPSLSVIGHSIQMIGAPRISV